MLSSRISSHKSCYDKLWLCSTDPIQFVMHNRKYKVSMIKSSSNTRLFAVVVQIFRKSFPQLLQIYFLLSLNFELFLCFCKITQSY